MTKGRCAFWWLVLMATLCLLAPAPGAAVPQDLPEEAAACLGCHGQKGITVKLQSGELLDAFIDAGKYQASRHASLSCSSCHSEFSGQAHPERTFKNRDQYASKASAVCHLCHAEAQLKKSPVHAALFSGGNRAPVCSGCHNPHAVTSAVKGTKVVSENDYCLGCHKHAMGVDKIEVLPEQWSEIVDAFVFWIWRQFV